ncbi:hypothetical protein DSO57_1023629 [Entomophthora muscae]|uniref:Uncharacterized protein n=1 Tax=Entomophthora muscae TaxID=34485 RepID=A0ACC2UN85_9FUNG|nr:hypothetical protein DSO57_1023629 [Entomophthora muscae]
MRGRTLSWWSWNLWPDLFVHLVGYQAEKRVAETGLVIGLGLGIGAGIVGNQISFAEKR